MGTSDPKQQLEGTAVQEPPVLSAPIIRKEAGWALVPSIAWLVERATSRDEIPDGCRDLVDLLQTPLVILPAATLEQLADQAIDISCTNVEGIVYIEDDSFAEQPHAIDAQSTIDDDGTAGDRSPWELAKTTIKGSHASIQIEASERNRRSPISAVTGNAAHVLREELISWPFAGVNRDYVSLCEALSEAASTIFRLVAADDSSREMPDYEQLCEDLWRYRKQLPRYNSLCSHGQPQEMPGSSYLPVSISAPPPQPPCLVQPCGDLVSTIQRQLRCTRNVGIVGMAGIGKTAVAREVFVEAADSSHLYDRVVWLTVGERPDFPLLLSHAYVQLDLHDAMPRERAHELFMATKDPLQELMELANSKDPGLRVLLVLDDVCLSTQHAAVAGLNFATDPLLGVEGSRLIVTTRQRSALAYYDQGHAWPMVSLEVVEVPLLRTQHAQQLLCHHAFRHRSAAPPASALKEAQNLLQSCGGHPQAVVELGSILALGRWVQWDAAVAACHKHVAEGVDAASVACARSVFALLPSARECFLDLAAFPENTLIPEADLVHLFATHAPFHTPHSVAAAARKLHELVQHSLVAVSTDDRGRRTIRVPGILHRLAARTGRPSAEAPQRCFNSDECTWLNSVRHYSLHAHPTNKPPTMQKVISDLPAQKLTSCILNRVVFAVGVPLALQLPRLRYLHISNADLSAAADAPETTAFKLPMLNFLCLANCTGVEAMLHCLLPAPELVHLDLKRSQGLAELPELASCSQLTCLSLRQCESLTTLEGGGIGRCRLLAHLDLSQCANLKGLPDCIGECTRLTRLSLDGCVALPMLPETLRKCDQLAQLDLRTCQSLEMLPKSMYTLRQLTDLDMLGCLSVKDLPRGLGGCSQLIQLDFSGCWHLTTLPNSIKDCVQLAKIVIKRCAMFEALPEGVGACARLAHLEVSWCRLGVLPNSIVACRQLARLDLCGCSVLQKLPDGIDGYAGLEHLDLSGCAQLEALPSNLEHCRRLVYLNLNGCKDEVVRSAQENGVLRGQLVEEDVGLSKKLASAASLHRTLHAAPGASGHGELEFFIHSEEVKAVGGGSADGGHLEQEVGRPSTADESFGHVRKTIHGSDMQVMCMAMEADCSQEKSPFDFQGFGGRFELDSPQHRVSDDEVSRPSDPAPQWFTESHKMDSRNSMDDTIASPAAKSNSGDKLLPPEYRTVPAISNTWDWDGESVMIMGSTEDKQLQGDCIVRADSDIVNKPSARVPITQDPITEEQVTKGEELHKLNVQLESKAAATRSRPHTGTAWRHDVHIKADTVPDTSAGASSPGIVRVFSPVKEVQDIPADPIMGLQAEVTAGNLEIAMDTALGIISCTMDPVVMAGQVLRAAQSLQEASVAAGMCEMICKDIQDTAINRLPVVCELLRLGQLFPEAEGAANLNKALLQCFKSVCDALHEARTAMYTYLQCNAPTRLRQAASVEELINERLWQLKNRFDDVNTHMSLANLLRSLCSAAQAQHIAAEVRGLQQQVEDLQRVHSADRAQVMALAQACAARQTPKGQKVRVSKSPLNAVAVSPSGDAFATAAADDGTVVTWDTASGTRVRELRRCEKRSSMFPSSSSSRKVKPFISVAWSPAADGSRVAAGSSDGTAMIWNAATGTCEHELQMHSDPVYSVAWSPDGSRLATGSGDAVAAIWDATTGTRTHELRGHDKAVWSVAWRPDGSSLATGSDDMIVVVWDAATGTCIHKLRGHGDRVHSVAWSPVWSSVAMASDHVDAVMWNMATGTSMHELLGHSVLVSSDPIAWSPNGSKVAMASRDKTAVVRDTATGTRIHELWGHSEDVRSVAWGRDGDLVLTASQDGTVRIYSLAGRKG